MTQLNDSNLGSIHISEDAIRKAISVAVLECRGVVSISSQTKGKGILLHEVDGNITVEVHIIVMYGSNIIDVCKNVQEKISFDLKTLLDLTVSMINVNVRGVKIADEHK